MRFAFQERPWDLFMVLGYALFVATLLLTLGRGNPMAIPLVLFGPGYVVLAAVFPSGTEIDWPNRIALSFGLSIVVVAPLSLVLSLTDRGVQFDSMIIAITAFVTLGSLVAFWRRVTLPPSVRLSASFELSVQKGNRNYLDTLVVAILVLGIFAAAGGLAYELAAPRPRENFTDFYIVSPSGANSGSSACLNSSQFSTVIVGVSNRENTAMNYTIRIELVGVRIVQNGTTGRNETVEVNRTRWASNSSTVNHGEDWVWSFDFQINTSGLWQLQLLLFKNRDFSSTFREVHLILRVPCP